MTTQNIRNSVLWDFRSGRAFALTNKISEASWMWHKIYILSSGKHKNKELPRYCEKVNDPVYLQRRLYERKVLYETERYRVQSRVFLKPLLCLGFLWESVESYGLLRIIFHPSNFLNSQKMAVVIIRLIHHLISLIGNILRHFLLFLFPYI